MTYRTSFLKTVAFSLAVLTMCMPSLPALAGPVSARSAILMDADSKQNIYAHNIHGQLPPASTTKVMTAILVLEKMRLDDVVTISVNATKALPSKIYVGPGEKYYVKDLLYAILLNSANDAAIALAEAVGGSEKIFVQMMNRRARELGAKRTKFANSHGLPTKIEQYTTARDMALIFRHALKNEFFRNTIELRMKKITSLQGREVSLKTHNKALFLGWKREIYGKTGYTKAAKSCFVGHIWKGKKHYILAVFGCSKRWDDVKYLLETYAGIDM